MFGQTLKLMGRNMFQNSARLSHGGGTFAGDVSFPLARQYQIDLRLCYIILTYSFLLCAEFAIFDNQPIQVDRFVYCILQFRIWCSIPHCQTSTSQEVNVVSTKNGVA